MGAGDGNHKLAGRQVKASDKSRIGLGISLGFRVPKKATRQRQEAASAVDKILQDPKCFEHHMFLHATTSDRLLHIPCVVRRANSGVPK